MRLSFLLLLVLNLFLTQNLFAQNCDPNVLKSKQLDAWTAQGLVPACMIKRETNNCQEIADELTGDEKKQIISCDKNSVLQNESPMSAIPNAKCIVNGVELAVEPFVNFGKWVFSERKPGEKSAFDSLRDSVISNYNKEKNCNESEAQKKAMVDAFNLGIEDERYYMDYRNVVDWTCGQIAQQLAARNQAYQKSIYDEIIRNKTAGKPYTPLKPNKNSEAMAEVFKGMQSVWHCYTVQAKADMACKIVTAFAVDSLMGVGIAKGLSTVASVVKSKKALSRIKKAIKNEEAINLDDAAKLRKADRLTAAQNMLGIKRPLMDSEKAAILKAHEIGEKEGRGFFTYTKDDIAEKARILRREGNFTPDQVRMLMEAGITGNNPADKAKAAWTVFGHTRLPYTEFSEQRKAGITMVLETLLSKSAKNQAVSYEELLAVAKTELSSTGMGAVEIERVAKEIDKQRKAIVTWLSGPPEVNAVATSTTTNAGVAAQAATKPPVAGVPTQAGQVATSGTSNSGVTLTSTNTAGSGATAERAVSSTGTTSTPGMSAAPTKPTVPGATTNAKPPAASTEVVLDAKKLQKARSDVDADYVRKKDKVYAAKLDDIPDELAQSDIDMLKKLSGKANDREIETLRNFSRGVKPEDLEAFLANPYGPTPQSIKNLKMIFPKLSKDNIEELLKYGRKVTKDEMPEFMRARSKRAEAHLQTIYGKDMDINRTIDMAFDEARINLKKLKELEAKLADPKTPSYSRQGIADQAEARKRIIEIEKEKCKKIVDLYIVAYDVARFTQEYKRKYNETCGTL